MQYGSKLSIASSRLEGKIIEEFVLMEYMLGLEQLFSLRTTDCYLNGMFFQIGHRRIMFEYGQGYVQLQVTLDPVSFAL